MITKISRMAWAKIRRRVNELVDLGMTTAEVMGLLDTAKEALEMHKKERL